MIEIKIKFVLVSLIYILPYQINFYQKRIINSKKLIYFQISNGTRMIFLDRSIQDNSVPTKPVAEIKKPWLYNVPVKLAKAMISCSTSYEGGKAIEKGTSFILMNVNHANSLLLYNNSQSSIKAIMVQNRELYHNKNIRTIRKNLAKFSYFVDHI